MRGRLSEDGGIVRGALLELPEGGELLAETVQGSSPLGGGFLCADVQCFVFHVQPSGRIMKKVCGAMTSLQGVFEFFEGAIEKQEDRAALRAARLALPTVAMPGVDDVWFGQRFMAPIRFGLVMWPLRFMTIEMEAAAIFCGGANAVLEGDERLEALGKLEFLGELIVGVETVAVVMESRDCRVMRYIVCSMADGSHICSCTTSPGDFSATRNIHIPPVHMHRINYDRLPYPSPTVGSLVRST
ncbi:expressed unknown protein [Ectocarpus siliculosus]|uniref:Uncharacterized protein n=1 Tax=Ectocarpus siliculosus TaxID=2880 RepID=D7G8P1_ECTSI|nr:expressed unknown protein [Ectocarpus siliculosus]|eukprot:CBJ28065.1 expressed unknown protein [Ectocarpus siliculosus]